jgi:hypothetical protein
MCGPVLSSSSHWRQSRKTSAGSQSSSSDHRRSPRRALPKRVQSSAAVVSDHSLIRQWMAGG